MGSPIFYSDNVNIISHFLGGNHSLGISPWGHKQINCKGTTCQQMWPLFAIENLAVSDFTPITTLLTSICMCKMLCVYTVLN